MPPRLFQWWDESVRVHNIYSVAVVSQMTGRFSRGALEDEAAACGRNHKIFWDPVGLAPHDSLLRAIRHKTASARWRPAGAQGTFATRFPRVRGLWPPHPGLTCVAPLAGRREHLPRASSLCDVGRSAPVPFVPSVPQVPSPSPLATGHPAKASETEGDGAPGALQQAIHASVRYPLGQQPFVLVLEDLLDGERVEGAGGAQL